MQRVIDIPEILFTKIQNGRADKRTLETVILHGTPLPEGHGRLIDADAVMNDICTSIDAMTNIGIAVDGEYLWAKLNDAIYDAPTIIEAESEDK